MNLNQKNKNLIFKYNKNEIMNNSKVIKKLINLLKTINIIIELNLLLYMILIDVN